MELQRYLPVSSTNVLTAPNTSRLRDTSIKRRVLQHSSGNLQPSALDPPLVIRVKRNPSLERDTPLRKTHGGRISGAARSKSKRSRRYTTEELESAAQSESKRSGRYTTEELENLTPEQIIANGKKLFQAYRERCDRKPKAMWPADLEEAFLEGHHIAKHVGKTKRCLVNGERLGKMELISEYMFRKTGKYRARKEVSSHAQVLKGFLDNKDTFEVFTEDNEQSVDLEEKARSPEDKLQLFTAGLYPSNLHPGYLQGRGRKPDSRRSRVPIHKPVTAAHSLRPSVYPVDFAMWAQRDPKSPTQNLDPSISDSVHVYTSLTTSPTLPPMPLESLSNWRTKFPRLSSLHHSGAVGCEITLLETSLNLKVPSTSLSGCVLATQFDVFASSAHAGHSWQCRTNIYCSGNLITTSTHEVPYADTDSEDGPVKLRPPFASVFWAQTFVQLGLGGGNRDAKAAMDRADQHVRTISVVQELLTTSFWSDGEAASETGSQLVALFLWQFRTTEKGEIAGKTTWRSLYPPPSRTLVNSPIPQLQRVNPLEGIMECWAASSTESSRPSINQDDDAFVQQNMFEAADNHSVELLAPDAGVSVLCDSFEVDYPQDNVLALPLDTEMFPDLTSFPNMDPYGVITGTSYIPAPEETYDTSCWQRHSPGFNNMGTFAASQSFVEDVADAEPRGEDFVMVSTEVADLGAGGEDPVTTSESTAGAEPEMEGFEIIF